MKICLLAAKLFPANGQTGRHDEANSRCLQFCESAWKWVCLYSSFTPCQ